MIKEPRLTLFDLAICLSDAADLVSPALVNHHKQVAYIASVIGAEMGLDDEQRKDLVLAGALHDMGALSLNERLESMIFDTREINDHAEVGYTLLRMFRPLRRIADIVRRHHCCWNQGEGDTSNGKPVPVESHIIHLADRIAILIDTDKEILGQADEIKRTISDKRGSMFHPEALDGFMAAAEKEYFWLDSVSTTAYRILRRKVRMKTLTLNISQLHDLARFFSRIIDFRSKFTATHSAGVAATAAALARFAGFSKRECEYMRIAGFLHDLGKLAVPKEILEKPGKLDKSEFDRVRSHTYYTYRILDTLEDFDTINTWGAFHHERLNAKGYPFHHRGDVLSLGSRIMAVSDIFTAVSEDRPYRPGMPADQVSSVLKTMASSDSIDPFVVSLLEEHRAEINEARRKVQIESQKMYRDVIEMPTPISEKTLSHDSI
ncbi:MAG: HD domain-containing protein [Chitinivibrionales bacterium]|nr:HD domain-containing protein [Chitinivibrionales bacterium]